MIRTRPLLLAAFAWAFGAGTAIGVGVLALSFVETSFLDDPVDPLARAEYLPGPAESPNTGAATATTSPSLAVTGPASSPIGEGVERLLASPGGTVVARCTDGNVYLVVWSPAQGFHAGSVERGPATTAKVEFESSTREIKVIVVCSDGVPQANVVEEQESGR